MRIPNAQTRIYIDFDAINYSIARPAGPYMVGDIMNWLDRGNNVILHEDSTFKYVLEPHNVGTDLDYTRDDKHLGIWYIEDAEPQYVIAHDIPYPWGEDLDDCPIHIFDQPPTQHKETPMNTYTITISTTVDPHSIFTVEVNAPDMEDAIFAEWPGAAAYVQEQYAAATPEEQDRFDVWVQVADEDEAHDVPFVDPFEAFDLPRPPHRTPMLIDAHTGDELRPATPEQIEASAAAGVYGYIYVDHEGNVVPAAAKDTPGWTVRMVWVTH